MNYDKFTRTDVVLVHCSFSGHSPNETAGGHAFLGLVKEEMVYQP